MYERLFNHSKVRVIEGDMKRIQQELGIRNKSVFATGKKTQYINRLSKLTKFGEIFTALDGDNDGLISSKKIDIDNIPIEILTTLSPLLFRMESEKLVFNMEQFLYAVDGFFKVSPVERRDFRRG